MPRPGLSPSELAEDLVARIEQGNTYARSRKNRFRSSSSVVKMVSLALTVASTIILGLQELNIWTGIAFSLVAIVTAVVLMPEPWATAGSGHLSWAPLRASIRRSDGRCVSCRHAHPGELICTPADRPAGPVTAWADRAYPRYARFPRQKKGVG